MKQAAKIAKKQSADSFKDTFIWKLLMAEG